MSKVFNICILAETNNLGGATMLIEKLGSYFTQNGCKVFVIYNKVPDDVKDRYSKSGIDLLYVDIWNDCKKYIAHLTKIDDPICVTFEWIDYVLVSQLSIKKKKTILYSIHYQTLAYGYEAHWLKRIRKGISKRALIDALNSDHIISMDEQTVRFTEAYYCLKKTCSAKLNESIIRIPVDIPEPIKLIENNKDNRNVKILTIARAAFPFKGYIIGLIRWFDEKRLDGDELRIVSYGKNHSEIIESIACVKPETRKHIFLYGKTDYEELVRYMTESNIYVGMGTTLLDASSRGILSIPVEAYTYDLVANSFFYDDPYCLAVDKGSKNNWEQIISSFREMGKEEYRLKSALSVRCVIENYSTQTIGEKLYSRFVEMPYDRFNMSIHVMNLYLKLYLSTK